MTPPYSTPSRPYSTDEIAKELGALQFPFPDFLARALVGLLAARKATLHQIAHLLPGEADPEAKRQQMRRFLDHPALGGGHWARALAPLLPKAPWTLALDRTEWHVGQTTVNLLVLSVVFAGCAVPLLWIVMPEAGASDTNERIQLMARFLSLFGVGTIRFVTADREFIGTAWVGWLLSQKVPFRIRIKAGEYLLHEDGREKRARAWFAFRACACKPRRMWLWGLLVFVAGKRLKRNRDEFLIVISDQRGDLLEEYRLRWKIECLFQAFKGRGFDLEASHLVDPLRLSAFFGFLALALCWCLRAGVFLSRLVPQPVKKHGRPPESLFHRGLFWLQALLAPLAGRSCAAAFGQAVQLLRVTS
jgi:hypothetical protein